jgi:hypothetical protein
MSKIKIPEIIEIDGEIQALDAHVLMDKNTYSDAIGNVTIKINLNTTYILNGVEICFKSQISHQFTETEKIAFLATLQQ